MSAVADVVFVPICSAELQTAAVEFLWLLDFAPKWTLNTSVLWAAAQLTFELEWDKLSAECNKSNLRSAQAEAEVEV